MAESNETSNDKVISADDALDINELASLNEDISNDFIEQLQNKISANSNLKNDGDLFEEVSENESKANVTFNEEIDDNFIKKYKAKLKKQKNEKDEEVVAMPHKKAPVEETPEVKPTAEYSKPQEEVELPQAPHSQKEEEVPAEVVMPPHSVKSEPEPPENKNDIETVTGGNIVEKPMTPEISAYNESLDYLDNNVNYSKYVVYIDPENKDFIDSLTVKERKNLINRIIREQDSISVTRRKFRKIQAVITHAIIAILTVTIAIPCIYWTINASLEATINSYRASQDVFSQLYKPHGKIQTK